MMWHVEYTVGVMVNDSKQFRTSRGLRESFTINLKRATVAVSSCPVTTARNFADSCRGGGAQLSGKTSTELFLAA
jgi:hypothetical protein